MDATETTSKETLEKASDLSKVTIDLEEDFEKKKEYTSIIYKIRNHDKELSQLLKKQDAFTDEDKARGKELAAKIEDYKKQLEELADNRVQFCHMKDVIKYIQSKLPLMEKKKIKVVGTVKCNLYKGKTMLQYVPSSIELVDTDTEEQLKIYVEIFYDKDAVDDDKKAKQLHGNVFIYTREKGTDRLYPVTIGLNYEKVDLEDTEDVLFLDFMRTAFEIHDKKQIHKNKVELNVINGSPVVEFDESCLTDRQKLAIAVGKNKLEDFRPKGNIYGDRIQELRLSMPITEGEFANGALEVFPVKELGDYLVSDDSDVSVTDIEDKKEETKPSAESNKAKMKSLFS